MVCLIADCENPKAGQTDWEDAKTGITDCEDAKAGYSDGHGLAIETVQI